MIGPVVKPESIKPGRYWLVWNCPSHGVTRTSRVLVLVIDNRLMVVFTDDKWAPLPESQILSVAVVAKTNTFKAELPEQVAVKHDVERIVTISGDRHFRLADSQDVLGMRVRCQATGSFGVVTEMNEYYVRVGNSLYSYAAFYALFVQLDGSPCGVPVIVSP
jgi:hypothetical protein